MKPTVYFEEEDDDGRCCSHYRAAVKMAGGLSLRPKKHAIPAEAAASKGPLKQL